MTSPTPAPAPLPAWPTLDSAFGAAFFGRMAQLYNCLRREGFQNPAAVGILANADMESAFRPGVVGDGGTAYSVFQWHWSPRGTAILAGTGIDVRTETSPGAIVRALVFELNSTYRPVLQALNAATTGADAAGKFCDGFEGAGAPGAHQRRQDDALRIEEFLARNAQWVAAQGVGA